MTLVEGEPMDEPVKHANWWISIDTFVIIVSLTVIGAGIWIAF
jgi:hypothetical protein